MRASFLLLLSLALNSVLATSPARADESVLSNAAAVVRAIAQKEIGQRFEFVATATVRTGLDDSMPLAVADDTGALAVHSNRSWHDSPVNAGDTVLVRGYVDRSEFCPACARLSTVKTIAPGNAPPPSEISGTAFESGRHDYQLVKVSGTVRDSFIDDIDPNYCVIVLDAGTTRIKIFFPSLGLSARDLDSLDNANVSATGLCLPTAYGTRRLLGRHLITSGLNSILVNKTSPDSPFDTPNLEDLRGRSGEEIARLSRRRVFGKVIAVWGERNFLVNHANRQIVRVELARGASPVCGDYVEVVGFPETDLYRINLSRALWRRTRTPNIPSEPAKDLSADSLFADASGRGRMDDINHGRLIRVSGTVRSIPAQQDKFNRMIIEDGGHSVPIDLSACPTARDGLVMGCKVTVTGVCVLDVENWRPNAVFPRIKGLFVVPRTSDDILIISRPPWWTAGRLLTILGALVTLLIGILIWNNTLRRRVETRSHELTNETVARVTSELKVEERTRLAMELHDSIVQNLTGVSMEIRTADRIADEDRDGLHRHLSLAVRTLDSCRKDLRNCLWDLRNLTLEETDVNDAIRRTLSPHVGNTTLNIRFNVPRDRISDNTAHAILSIIRELAINAVQHGKATSIKVAGSIEGGKLLFSVKDNGCGFDPDSIPGMAQGHFGLQGIRDRIDSFEGEITVSSSPGHGTKVTVALTAPDKAEDEMS